MVVLIGTSGWSYDSWAGPFYPEDYLEFKNLWLEYYCSRFPTVEIVSTAFQLPSEKVVESWLRKTEKFEKFDFSVVTPYYISHHLLKLGEFSIIKEELKKFEERVVEPLYEAGRLGMILFELSPTYSYTQSNYHKLLKVLDLFKYLSYKYAVEFQHRSWLNLNHDDIRENVLFHLKKRNIALCVLDGESFPFLLDRHSQEIYVHLHGRNKEAWKRSIHESVPSTELFDYSYSDGELLSLIEELEVYKDRTLRIYFKNHTKGYAAQNALRLMEILKKSKTLRIARETNVQTTFKDF